VPSVPGELDAWQAAADLEVLGPAAARTSRRHSIPLPSKGSRRWHPWSTTATTSLDLSSAETLQAVLRTLNEAGYTLAASDVYACSIAKRWPTRGGTPEDSGQRSRGWKAPSDEGRISFPRGRLGEVARECGHVV